METITIPSTYLADARAAVRRNLSLGGELLEDSDPQDRASNVEMLDRDVRLRAQLLVASDDVEVSAERDTQSSPLELRWAVSEATRIWPRADERVGA